jgi:hypothetical protein
MVVNKPLRVTIDGAISAIDRRIDCESGSAVAPDVLSSFTPVTRSNQPGVGVHGQKTRAIASKANSGARFASDGNRREGN